MPTSVNDNGAWKDATNIYVNDNGTWKEVVEGYVNDNGTWKLFHSLSGVTIENAILTESSKNVLTEGGDVLTYQ